MTYITTTATVSSDIDFVQQGTSEYSRAFTNLQGSVGYSIGMVGGSGAGYRQIDCIYNLGGYVVPSGETREYDFRALYQEAFGSSYTISLTGLKAMIIRNNNTGINEILHLKATGLGFSGLFHGDSGNVRIEPGGVYAYTNPYFGVAVSDNESKLQITNVGSGSGAENYNTGISISIVAAGTSGTG
jgi:hypothetical protein